MISERSVVIRTAVASLSLVVFVLTAWKLSGKGLDEVWFIFAAPAALLAFELAEILQAYKKRNGSLDKLVAWVFKVNLGLMASAEILSVFRSLK